MPKNRLEGFESTRMQFKICPQNVIANKMRMENRRNLFEWFLSQITASQIVRTQNKHYTNKDQSKANKEKSQISFDVEQVNAFRG